MTDVGARRLEMLGEFAELLLATARDLHQAGLAADDLSEKARLADSLHRTGRGLRQTLALHARLERDEKRGRVEDDQEARHAAERQVATRRKRVATSVERLIWTEREQDDAEELTDQLESLLDAEVLEDGFAKQPIDQLVAHICDQLGLDPPPARSAIRGRCPRGAEGVSPEADRPVGFNPLSRSATAPPQGGASGPRPSG